MWRWILFLVLSVWAATVASPYTPAVSGLASNQGDLKLYETIGRRVANGEGYYTAAVAEQHAAGYPLRPSITVRFPTLSYIMALVPPKIGVLGLLAACVLACIGGLSTASTGEKLAAALLVVAAGWMAFLPAVARLHELWAGLLLSLALILYREARWWPTVLLVALAVAIREHAILFGAIFGIFALKENRRSETIAWLALGLAFVLGLLAHDHAVSSLVTTADKASPGWLALRGPAAFVIDVVTLTPLQMLPPWIAGPLVLLPFVGWLALGGALGKRAACVFLAYAAVYSVIGRENNFYWGQLVLPMFAIGAAFSWRVMRHPTRSALKSTLPSN